MRAVQAAVLRSAGRLAGMDERRPNPAIPMTSRLPGQAWSTVRRTHLDLPAAYAVEQHRRRNRR